MEVMKGLQSCLHVIDSINEWTGRAVALLCVVMMFLITCDVILRYIFNSPLDWQMEVSQFLMLVMVCLGAGYTELYKEHVNVTLFYEKWSLRTRAVVDLITHPLAIVMIVLLILDGGQIFWQNYIHEFKTSSVWGPVQWPAKLMVPLAGFLLGIQIVAKLARAAVAVLRGEELRSRYVTKC